MPTWQQILDILVSFLPGLRTLAEQNRATIASWNLPAKWYTDLVIKLDDLLNNTPPDPTAEIRAVRSDSSSPHLPTIADVLTAIDLDNHTVVLPTSPPSGYGGVSAANVWAYTDPNFMHPEGDELATAAAFAQTAGGIMQVRRAGAPWFWLEGPWGTVWLGSNILRIPSPDWDDIQPGDTIGTWLARTDDRFDWAWDQYSGTWWAWLGATSPNNQFIARCAISPADWAALTGASSTGTGSGAPVWPGSDGVTLGSPVVLTADGSVEGPMDGVLVHIDSVEPRTSGAVVGDLHSYYHAGSLSFVNDAGAAEVVQWLSWSDAQYTPQHMVRAASALVVLGRATQVTVTPWTTNTGA